MNRHLLTALVSPLVFLAAAVALPRSASADDPKFQYGKQEDVKAVVWKATAQVGGVFTTGNSRSITVSGGFDASRNDGKNKVSLDLAGAYARSTVYAGADNNGNGTIDDLSEIGDQTTTSAANFIGKLRYDRFFTANDSLYIAAFAGLDQPASKEFFTGGQIGYARQLVKTKMHALALELGYDFSYVSYTVPIDSYVMLHSARVFLGYTLTINDSTTLSANTEALINLNPVTIANRDVGVAEASRLYGQLALTTKLWKALSFRASFTARFDNAPGERATLALPYAAGFTPLNDKLDTITEVGLIVDFI